MTHPRKRYRGFFFLLFVPLLLGALAGVVMVLWNAVLPDVLGVKPLSYWQALGLLILSRILMGGFRPGGGSWGRSGWSRSGWGRSGWSSPPGRRPPRGRWENLSDEERTRLKEEWRKRCGR